jgi:hypothetical protein
MKKVEDAVTLAIEISNAAVYRHGLHHHLAEINSHKMAIIQLLTAGEDYTTYMENNFHPVVGKMIIDAVQKRKGYPTTNYDYSDIRACAHLAWQYFVIFFYREGQCVGYDVKPVKDVIENLQEFAGVKPL